jgi:hypothetical protein
LKNWAYQKRKTEQALGHQFPALTRSPHKPRPAGPFGQRRRVR